MSLQATEATVVTLGEDNLIIRWVVFMQSCISPCETPHTPIVSVMLH